MSTQSSLMIIGVVILTLIAPVSVKGESACLGTPYSRLAIGIHGRTTLSGDTATHLRSGSGTNYKVVLTIPNGTEFDVIDGPRCGTYLWWQIKLLDGTIGWVPEGRGTSYFLEPFTATSLSSLAPIETNVFTSSFGSLSFSYPDNWGISELRLGNIILKPPSTSGNTKVVVTLNILEGLWGVTEDHVDVQGTTAQRRIVYSNDSNGTESEIWELEFYVDGNRMYLGTHGARAEIQPLETPLLSIAQSLKVGQEYISALTDNHIDVAERFPSGKASVSSVEGTAIGIQARPGMEQPLIETLAGGTIVDVLDGPDDTDGQNWWYVKTPGGRTGWIEEFAYETYILFPVSAEQTGSSSSRGTFGTVDTSVNSAAETGCPPNGAYIKVPPQNTAIPLYGQPSITSSVIEYLKAGQCYSATGFDSSELWIHIRADDEEGWVAQEQVQVFSAHLPPISANLNHLLDAIISLSDQASDAFVPLNTGDPKVDVGLAGAVGILGGSTEVVQSIAKKDSTETLKGVVDVALGSVVSVIALGLLGVISIPAVVSAPVVATSLGVAAIGLYIIRTAVLK